MADAMKMAGEALAQELELEQEEVEAMLGSLPKCRATWKQPPIMYQYKGMWLYKDRLPSVLCVEKHFSPKPSDILLVTSMKVGTTWLKALAFVITKRHLHQFDDPHHPLLKQVSHELVTTIEYNGIQEIKKSSQTSSVFHTHLHYSVVGGALKSSNCRVVFLCRNQCDTFVSMWKFFNEIFGYKEADYISMEEAFEMFSNGTSLFGPFWDHVMGYWNASKERPHQFLFMSYEELLKDQTQQVKKLAEFVGFPFTQEEENAGAVEQVVKLCSFENLSKLEANKTGKFFDFVAYNSFYRKGKVGDSANYLSSEMVKRLNSLADEKFEGCELKPFMMAR